MNGSESSHNDRYFTITACLIKRSDYDALRDSVMEIKNKYWRDALYMYKEQEKRICFHSREIRGKMEAFSCKLIDYPAFIEDLSQLISTAPITLISSSIDKFGHIAKYKYPETPYALCMNFVLERIIMKIPRSNKCDVILESRGRKEDYELLNHIKLLIDNRNSFINANGFKIFNGVFFNPKWSLMHDCKKSYWGLEIADLCAYPIHKYLTYGTKDKAFETLEPKLYNYPKVNGYGLKKFP